MLLLPVVYAGANQPGLANQADIIQDLANQGRLEGAAASLSVWMTDKHQQEFWLRQVCLVMVLPLRLIPYLLYLSAALGLFQAQ